MPGEIMSEEIRIRLTQIESRVGGLEDDTKRIIKLLEGNGTPGLVMKVDRNERSIIANTQSISEMADSSKWLFRTLAAALLLILINFGWHMIRTYEAPQRHTSPAEAPR